MRRTALLVRTFAPVAALLVAGRAAEAQSQAYALRTVNGAQQLVRFDLASPGNATVLGATGTSLTAIDFRPANNVLYGFNGSALFTLNLTTGAATQVGAGIGETLGGDVAFDFNPTVDRIRLVGPNNVNRRLNPDNGANVLTNGQPDGPYNYETGDANAGATPSFNALAYTGNLASNFGGTTMLLGIDRNFGTLVQVLQANGGNVRTLGAITGLPTGASVTGFDILTVGSANLAFFTTVGSAGSSLYRLDLGTRSATLVGNFAGGVGVQGLAISAVPEPGTWALMGTGLVGLAGFARRRRRAA